MCDPGCRGQLSVPMVEAAIGVLLVLAVTAAFVIAPMPTPDADHELDRFAEDTVRVLQRASGDGTPPPITRAIDSKDRFESARPALKARLTELLPPGVLFRVETPHGALGHPRPDGVVHGQAILPTTAGPVSVVVWRV